MKYDSAISYTYKVNLIGCLFDRAFKICSSYHSLHIEIERLKKYFTQNGFPIKLIENQIRRKLDNVLNPKPKVQVANKKTIYASIPYISNFHNKQISDEVRKLVCRFYPQLDAKIIFKNSFSICSFFRSKDLVPPMVGANLVYIYSCEQCNATYIGETSHHLKTRICEHLGVSSRTGNPTINPVHSSIRDHALESHHDLKIDNFKILFRTTPFNLRLAESIQINKLKPNLNNMQSSAPLQILS